MKSLLTSLFQREEKFPSIKRGLRGVFLIGDTVGWGEIFRSKVTYIQF